MFDHYPAQVREQLAQARTKLAAAEAERDEARAWARHGYEIGQRHCGWTDHGVAPAWLTDGWPPHIDTCRHLTALGQAKAERVAALRRLDYAQRSTIPDLERRIADHRASQGRWRARAEQAEARIAAIRALAATLRATHAVGGRWDGLQEAADDIDELLDAAPSADPALVVAEDALTRVIRLAATLPPTVRTQIEQAIDGTAGQPSVVPCPGRLGFCRPCRTIHSAASSTAPAAEQGAHDYLSTGCLHGEHAYCQGHTGAAGTKVPAQCKFCAAPCRCDCHAVADGPS